MNSRRAPSAPMANGETLRPSADFPSCQFRGRAGLMARFGEESIMPVNGLAPYDDSNVFARILRGEIPCRKVFEDDHVLAFHDIHPQAPIHVLVIPKTRYVSFADFTAKGSDAEIASFFRAVREITRALGLEANGYRLLTNMGVDANQEIAHFHVHIFAGRPLGPMLAPA